MESCSPCHRWVVIGLVASSNLAGAHGILLSLPSLGVASYDSDVDGFGVLVSGFDLGSIHSDFAGVTVEVSTETLTNPLDSRAWSSGLQPLPAVARGPVKWSFEFSTPVMAEFRSEGQTLNSGERLRFEGGGQIRTDDGAEWASELVVTDDSLVNLGNDPVVQDFLFGGGISELWTYTQEDVMGLFSGQSMGLALIAVPEPSRFGCLCVAGLIVAVRRKRR